MQRLAILTLFFSIVFPAQATPIFALDNPFQSASPGATVVFTGTLFNDETFDVFLNGAFATLPYLELSVDFTDFFALVPPSLTPGGSYTGPIFEVVATNAAVSGHYFGSFTIQGGPDGTSVNDLATENFQITISADVPEPCSWCLVGLTLLSAFAFRRSRQYTKSSNGPI